LREVGDGLLRPLHGHELLTGEQTSIHQSLSGWSQLISKLAVVVRNDRLQGFGLDVVHVCARRGSRQEVGDTSIAGHVCLEDLGRRARAVVKRQARG